ncbi:MAG: hypothetical protein ANABAC_0525 [Anaerolineae bacterium]|nr:MAG: hypothetical protein ANABAC_0525 [Anaerolineae bacterium]
MRASWLHPSAHLPDKKTPIQTLTIQADFQIQTRKQVPVGQA